MGPLLSVSPDTTLWNPRNVPSGRYVIVVSTLPSGAPKARRQVPMMSSLGDPKRCGSPPVAAASIGSEGSGSTAEGGDAGAAAAAGAAGAAGAARAAADFAGALAAPGSAIAAGTGARLPAAM